MALTINYIDSKKMKLSDNSEWLFWPGMEPSLSWKVDDQVKRGAEGKFSIKFINITRKNEEAGVFPISASGEIEKTLGKDGSAKEYANINTEITIKNASGELIWLQDGSKWQMYNPALGDPGSWEIGDMVIVTWRVAKSMSKTYEMQNVKTGKALIAIFLGHE